MGTPYQLERNSTRHQRGATTRRESVGYTRDPSMAARGQQGGRAGGARFAQFKLVLLGESAVGKSSLVLRFVKDQFDDYRESTIGAAFLTQTIALAGNKSDMVTDNPDKRAIQTADAEQYAKEAGLLFFETSAKTSTNVKELFTAIAKKFPLDQAGPRNLRANTRPGVDLRPESTQQGAGGCQC